MRRLSTAALAGAILSLFAASASAADMIGVVPPPVVPVPVPIETGIWYLRGDIGLSSNTIGNLDVLQGGHPVRNSVGVEDYQLRSKTFTETVSVGVGIGYSFTPWLRVDVTGEFRGGGRIRGVDYTQFVGGGDRYFLSDFYDGNVRSWVGLANLYVDLGTFCTFGCLTPYLGAGIGFANTSINGFTDMSAGYSEGGGAIGSTNGYANSTSRTNFAWALMAGLGYKVNDRLTLELGYRYLNLGDLPAVGLRDPATGQPRPSIDTIQVHSLASHEIRLGMRWMLTCTCARPVEPIVARY